MPHIFLPELAYELWDFYFARRISVVQGKCIVNQQSTSTYDRVHLGKYGVNQESTSTNDRVHLGKYGVDQQSTSTNDSTNDFW